MTRDEQRAKAERFLALHHAPPLLVLANAWDVVSARLFQLHGFRAIGTTSAGIAATLGYPDGQRMGLEENLAVVRRIAQRIDLPVSADIEAGYSHTVEGVVRAAREVMRAGAVGLNLEDATGRPSEPLFDVSSQAEKIAAVRATARSEGIPLVINARTDVLLHPRGETADLIPEVIARANAYVQAGADCAFVPDGAGLDRRAIGLLVKEIAAPVNLIAGPGVPPLRELEELGVARVSFGPRMMRATLAQLGKMAREVLDRGTFSSFTGEALSYADVNGMLEHDDRGYCAGLPPGGLPGAA